jgi:hypothetical protein
MSDSPTRSAAPDAGAEAGYRPFSLFSPDLTLSPFVQSRLGWYLMSWDCQVRSLRLQDGDDDALRTPCGALSQQLRLSPRLDPYAAAPSFLNALQPDDWDTLYKLLRLAGPTLAWTDVPGAQRNIVTGGPVSRGKIDSSGTFVPSAPDDLIAGFGVPSPAIKLGKRFLFASDPDVHLYLYLDKDAYANEIKYFASGGGIQFGGKTSGGTQLKLRLGVGRDTAGGGAGFIKLQIGPDYAPMTPAP